MSDQKQVQGQEFQKERTRYLAIVCYSDPDPLIKYYNTLKWAWIIHDKDFNEDGTSVEPHYHLYLYIKNAVEADKQYNIIKSSGIMQGTVLIEACRNKQALLDYFTHSEHYSKTVYSTTCIKSNFNVSESAALAEREYTKTEKAKRLIEDLKLMSAGRLDVFSYLENDPLRVYQPYVLKSWVEIFRFPQFTLPPPCVPPEQIEKKKDYELLEQFRDKPIKDDEDDDDLPF